MSPSNDDGDLRLQPKPYHALVGVLLETGFVVTSEYNDSDVALIDATKMAADGELTIFGVRVKIAEICVSVGHKWLRGDPPHNITLRGGDNSVRPN